MMTTLAASALVLAACGGDDPEATVETVTVEAPAPAVETVTVTPEPTTEASLETEPTTEAPGLPTTDPPEEAAAESDFGESETSVRGYLIKEVGQLAGVVDADTEEPVVSFTLLEVEPNFTCTADYADGAANGQFVAFTFEVETFKALKDDVEPFYGSFGLNSFYLSAFSDDGVLQNDIDGNSWSCLDSADELPSDIGPGQKAIGKIVIDTELESGVLVYEPMSWGEPVGWEWEF